MRNLLNYTEPKLNKGKKPSFIPKGSNLEKEWAKNTWYINYSYEGKQYRVKRNLNRITDPKEKKFYADVLLTSLKQSLEDGYNPENPDEFIKKQIRTDLNLAEVAEIYLDDLKQHARPKTHQSYQSKLRYFVEENKNKSVNDIQAKDLKKFIQSRINKVENVKIHKEGRTIELDKKIAWTNKTVKSARGIFRTFFNWLIKEGYYNQPNPMSNVPLIEIHSENRSIHRNIPFTDQDNQLIMEYLDQHDKPIAFFCRVLYYSCLRPGELIKLKVRDINFERRKIVIPLSVSKNTRSIEEEEIHLTDELFNLFYENNYQNADPDYYIVTDSEQYFGSKIFGRDTPYKRFKKALGKLNLHDKGYVLYSFKHFSNIKRLNSEKWKIADLMVANRHANISMTLVYLKNLKNESNISHLSTPKI